MPATARLTRVSNSGSFKVAHHWTSGSDAVETVLQDASPSTAEAGMLMRIGLLNYVAGALVMEIVFSYPGIGLLLYNAVTSNDYPLVQGIFLVISLSVLAACLIADVVYVIADPRTRTRSAY